MICGRCFHSESFVESFLFSGEFVCDVQQVRSNHAVLLPLLAHPSAALTARPGAVKLRVCVL